MDEIINRLRDRADKLKYYRDTLDTPVTTADFFDDAAKDLEAIQDTQHVDCRSSLDVDCALRSGFYQAIVEATKQLKRTDLKTRGDLIEAIGRLEYKDV